MGNARLLLKVGVLNALCVTVVAAVSIVALSGAGRDAMPNDPGSRTDRSWVQRLWDIGKATLLVSPLTALTCGPFGLAAGAFGVRLMDRQNQQRGGLPRSFARYVFESAELGLRIGLLYPFYDIAFNGAMGMFGGNGVLVVLAPACGIPCGIVCGLAFRWQFWVRSSPTPPGIERLVGL